MYKIFIVEDDPVIAQTLADNLFKWGCEAVVADDLWNVTAQFVKEEPHIVIMDIVLPCYNGYYWCNEIRKVSKVPIIFLSSKNDNMDIVMAINMGGDDFISKPFATDILVAKIQAMLRRTYDYKSENSDNIEHRGAVLLLGEASLVYKNQKIELTKNEFRILEVLMRNKNNIVSRDKIMKKLWNDDSFIDDNTLTVNLNRLRKKLDAAGLTDFIETKKGLGYMVSD